MFLSSVSRLRAEIILSIDLHGLVGWVGGGSIMQEVYEIDNFLYNFGFGHNNTGLYFNFTEAF